MNNTTVQSYQVDNKRIAKNAIFLYIRTFIVMIISLLTSRVVLKALGVIDYGIYNVVGGIIILFSFLNTSMASASQRFFTFEIGKNNPKKVNYYFNISILAHLTIGFFMVIICETVGLWFMNTQLDIPPDRFKAAQWVYQFTIIGGFFQIIRIPFHAAIMSFEKMDFYAYVNIFETVLKLGVALILLKCTFDRLILYSILMVVVIAISDLVQFFYCLWKFPECKISIKWDKKGYFELMSFSGWAMCSGMANVAASQGLSFIFNILRGVILNAAVGVMNQVTMGVSVFFGSFQAAFTPQLIKNYSAGNWSRFYSLLYKSSRFSYFLSILIGIPLVVYCEPLLNIWLVEVPPFAVAFSQVMILYFVIDSLACPLWTSIRATGNIKQHELITSFISILNLPLAFLILKQGLSPVFAIGIKVFLNAIAYISRIYLMKKQIGMQIMAYMRVVVKNVFLVTITSLPIPILLKFFLHGLLLEVIGFGLSIISISIVILFVGMSVSERKLFFAKANAILKRK